jgi:hypothetical protein
VRLSDLKITSRIYGGFGLLVLLGNGVAGFGVWQLATIGSGVGRLVSAADDNARAIELGELVQSLRHLALKFKISADDSAVKQFAADQARAVDILGAIAKSDGVGDLRELLTTRRGQLATARDSFERLRAAISEETTDRAKLLAAGTQLQAAGHRLATAARETGDVDLDPKAGDMEAALLGVRAATLSFIAKPDAAGVKEAGGAASAANESPDVIEQATQSDAVRAQLAPARAALGESDGELQACEDDADCKRRLRPCDA